MKEFLGTKVIDFTFQDLDGNTISIKDYMGKKLLIFMWASW
ncbi:TlpA family protein disulfide reductase [Alkaliphilus hydrothermalis]|uniref:Peroxiredoxin n=1 Tax=Alkaliphilus hydrothermalis TaxID=1482730 RepID=A0ABS2NTE7_9FIRM|nr:peroxiredoxin [Alkaliphilus hydrothermalis]